MIAANLIVTISSDRRPVWQWPYYVLHGFVRRYKSTRYTLPGVAARVFWASYIGTRVLKINGKEYHW